MQLILVNAFSNFIHKVMSQFTDVHVYGNLDLLFEMDEMVVSTGPYTSGSSGEQDGTQEPEGEQN